MTPYAVSRDPLQHLDNHIGTFKVTDASNYLNIS